MVNVIIVAAGKGVRMGTVQRKQYLIVAGHPILSHTLQRISACAAVDHICMVIPQEDFDYCHEHILSPAEMKKPVKLVAGGSERQQSVFRGLKELGQKDGLVAIHDGVRPLIDPSLIDDCIRVAAVSGACIPGIPVADTIKKANPKGYITETVERNGLWLIQTPQVFEYRIIMDAHKRAQNDGYAGTDDASLVERMGYPVNIIRGSKANIKVTTDEDLIMAAALLNSDNSFANL